MMKYLILLLTLLSIQLNAQTMLTFNKSVVECEDKWVVYPKNDSNTYIYGFIYIDETAGLTLNYEGHFKILSDGTFEATKLDNTSMKVRLEPNGRKVAIIPESKFKELDIKPIQEWLSTYKKDEHSIKRLYKWGFLYNSWDQCEKALTFLEEAQKTDPKFPGLEFELAYAYNALEQYEKAIIVLNNALETAPNDCYLFKELSFAQMNLGQLNQAEETCHRGISNCKEESIKCEMAYNMAHQYFKSKNKGKFKEWVEIAKKHVKEGDIYAKYINQLETKFDQ